MIPTKHPLFLTFSTLLAGIYFFISPLNDALRPAAFVLLAFLVMVLVVREITEHRRAEEAAQKARSLNEELEQSSRKLETEIADHRKSTEQLRLLTAHLNSIHLDAERSTAVFRILQEALTNVARHAQATRVEASLREEEGHPILQVRDNGRGISEEQSSSPGQFGLLGMRERAHIFGGDVLVKGSPGQGTAVTLRIPVNRQGVGGGD